MVLDNRLYNDMEKDTGTNEADIKPNINAQIDNIDLDTKVINTAEKHGEINNVADMRNAFAYLREEAPKSLSSADLTMIYGQAGNLIKLLDTGPFIDRVGDEIDEFRQAAEAEFAQTARVINKRAVEIGVGSRYSEKWGE